ncbi:MAG: zf-HC2 domain-containing protein, partial [Thermomicrobiales bacterium]
MISHAEAQALTSARLDAALDPVAERELVTHLSTCPSCRTFAEQSNALVSGLRELPYLPASPTVSRAVHSYIGKPRSPWAKLGTIVPLQGMPAFSAIAAALLVVFFSVFVYLRVDRTGTPLDPGNDDSETTEIGGFIEAPETTATFAIVETEQAEDRATESDADSATESSDPSATVEAESSDSTEPADDAQSTSLPEEDEPTSEPESTTASDSDETDAPPEPTVTIELAEPTQTSEEDATGQGTDPEPTDETNSVLTAP